jgi:hypothetical protein
MSLLPLHIRTELLELMEWDEELTDEAIHRAVDMMSSLYLQGVPPQDAPKRARKMLSEEYEKKVVNLLVEYVTVMANKIQTTGEA